MNSTESFKSECLTVLPSAKQVTGPNVPNILDPITMDVPVVVISSRRIMIYRPSRKKKTNDIKRLGLTNLISGTTLGPLRDFVRTHKAFYMVLYNYK